MSEKRIAEFVGGPYDGLKLEVPPENPKLIRFNVTSQKQIKKCLEELFSTAAQIPTTLPSSYPEVFDFYEFEKEIEVEVEGMNPDQTINIMTYAGRGIMD